MAKEDDLLSQVDRLTTDLSYASQEIEQLLNRPDPSPNTDKVEEEEEQQQEPAPSTSDNLVSPAPRQLNPSWSHQYNYGEPDIPWIGMILSEEKCNYSQTPSQKNKQYPPIHPSLIIETRNSEVQEKLMLIEKEFLAYQVPFNEWVQVLRKYLRGIFSERLPNLDNGEEDYTWLEAVLAVMGKDIDRYYTDRAVALASWKPVPGQTMNEYIAAFHHLSVGVPFWMMPPKFRLNVMINGLEPYFPNQVAQVRSMVQNNVGLCYQMLEQSAAKDYKFPSNVTRKTTAPNLELPSKRGNNNSNKPGKKNRG